MNKHGSHTEIRRYLDREEAIKDGAYNLETRLFPPDPWGTQVVLTFGKVRVRNCDGASIR